MYIFFCFASHKKKKKEKEREGGGGGGGANRDCVCLCIYIQFAIVHHFNTRSLSGLARLTYCGRGMKADQRPS